LGNCRHQRKAGEDLREHWSRFFSCLSVIKLSGPRPIPG